MKTHDHVADILTYINRLESDNEGKQKRIEELESRVAQFERERVELLKDFKQCVSKPQKACKVCANRGKPLCSECERWDLFEWLGVCPENTKEE